MRRHRPAPHIRPRLAYWGHGCWSLDKIGPICRPVDDTALVLAAINGFDPHDEGSIAAPFGWDATRPAAGLRVGYFAVNDTEKLDLDVLETVRSLGVATFPLELPDLPYDALRHLLFAEAAAAFEELTLEDTDDTLARQDAGAWSNSFRKARFISAVDHIQLDRLRRRVMQEMDALFSGVDVLLALATTGHMTLIGNMTGHPCLTIRAGFTEMRTREMPAYLDAEIKAMEGPAHTVPYAITIVAPSSTRLRHSPSAVRSRQHWQSQTVGRTCSDEYPAHPRL